MLVLVPALGEGEVGDDCLAARALSWRSSWGRKTETWRGDVGVGEQVGWVVDRWRVGSPGRFGS